jgi:hypothetical protein
MIDGALVSAAAARLPFRMVRRVVIVMPPLQPALAQVGHGQARRVK